MKWADGTSVYWLSSSYLHPFSVIGHIILPNIFSLSCRTHTHTNTRTRLRTITIFTCLSVSHLIHFVPSKMWIYVSCKRVGSRFQPVGGLAFSNSTLCYSLLVISSCPFITLMKWRPRRTRASPPYPLVSSPKNMIPEVLRNLAQLNSAMFPKVNSVITRLSPAK